MVLKLMETWLIFMGSKVLRDPEMKNKSLLNTRGHCPCPCDPKGLLWLWNVVKLRVRVTVWSRDRVICGIASHVKHPKVLADCTWEWIYKITLIQATITFLRNFISYQNSSVSDRNWNLLTVATIMTGGYFCYFCLYCLISYHTKFRESRIV